MQFNFTYCNYSIYGEDRWLTNMNDRIEEIILTLFAFALINIGGYVRLRVFGSISKEKTIKMLIIIDIIAILAYIIFNFLR